MNKKEYLKEWRKKQPKGYSKKYYEKKRKIITGNCIICDNPLYFPAKKYCSKECLSKGYKGHTWGFQKGRKNIFTPEMKEKIRQSMLKQYREGKRDNQKRPTGKDVWSWKGGKRIDNGYVYLYNGVGKRHKAEHRIVMEKIIGRKLNTWEHIHHKNRIRNDNRPENLLLVTRNVHKSIEGKREVVCPFCKKEFGLE